MAHKMKATRATASKFLQTHSIGVLATTAADGRPVTSSIYYAWRRTGVLGFLTKESTSKFQNMSRDPNVAVTVRDAARPIAVNLRGPVQRVNDPPLARGLMHEIGVVSHFDSGDLPPVLKYQGGDYAVVAVTVNSIEYTDYSDNSPYDDHIFYL